MSDADDTYYFERYGDLELQRRMVADRARTSAFAQAIREVVRPGDVVLDVGCGTGVLAMLAARAGARRVVAIDQSGIVQSAANLVKHNDLADRVEVLRGPVAELELDAPVDLLVSEWLGNFALVEDMWADVAAVRDRVLAPDGRMLPESVDLYLAPVDDAVGYFGDGPGFWRSTVEDLDFSPLEELELRQGRAVQARIDASALLASEARVASVDARRDGPDAGQGSGDLELICLRDGQLVGFVGWFEAQLSPSVRLSTGPRALETHWSQTFLPFPPRLVRAGEVLRLRHALSTHPDERRHVSLELGLGETQLSFRLE
jgi:SAM-dependent methyltransferase